MNKLFKTLFTKSLRNINTTIYDKFVNKLSNQVYLQGKSPYFLIGSDTHYLNYKDIISYDDIILKILELSTNDLKDKNYEQFFNFYKSNINNISNKISIDLLKKKEYTLINEILTAENFSNHKLKNDILYFLLPASHINKFDIKEKKDILNNILNIGDSSKILNLYNIEAIKELNKYIIHTKNNINNNYDLGKKEIDKFITEEINTYISNMQKIKDVMNLSDINSMINITIEKDLSSYIRIGLLTNIGLSNREIYEHFKKTITNYNIDSYNDSLKILFPNKRKNIFLIEKTLNFEDNNIINLEKFENSEIVVLLELINNIKNENNQDTQLIKFNKFKEEFNLNTNLIIKNLNEDVLEKVVVQDELILEKKCSITNNYDLI